jgi:hypothetical protein
VVVSAKPRGRYGPPSTVQRPVARRVGGPSRRSVVGLLVALAGVILVIGAIGMIPEMRSATSCTGTGGDPAQGAADTRPLVITDVSAFDITDTSAAITWTIDEAATGQVEYGPTQELGNASEKESSFDYCTHVQTLTGLVPGQRYFYRTISENEAGDSAVSETRSFTTLRSVVAPACAPVHGPGGDGSTDLVFRSGAIYGTGLNGDGKSNRTIAPGRDVMRHAIRWRASTTSELRAVVIQWRTSLVEPDYSGGNLGTYRITVQTDDGSPAHRPSGTVLASMTIKMSEVPGIGGEGHKIRRHEFPDPPLIQKGRLHHLVFENVDSDPAKNYIAINHLFTWDRLDPRQPMFRDRDLAVLGSQDARGDDWREDRFHTPNIDLEYADGFHDGQAYQNNHIEHYALIGGDDEARERFTVSGGDRTVMSLWVRVNRQYGRGLLTLRLEDERGSLIEEHEVRGSDKLGTWELGSASDAGDWVGVSFDTPRVLQDGETYCLRLSAPEGTQFATVSLLSRSAFDIDGEYMKSYRFSDGRSERSTDGGRSWASVDPAWADYLNTQFYFTLDGDSGE